MTRLAFLLALLLSLPLTSCFQPPAEPTTETPTEQEDEDADAEDADAEPSDDGTEDDASPASEAPGQIDLAMYWLADVRDDEACELVYEEGEIAFAGVSNPYMSCPDAFSWKLLLDAIQQEFWATWAADELTWPQEDFPPDDAVADTTGAYPLCSDPGADPARCCDPASLENPGYDDPAYPAKHCPYLPALHRDQEGYVAPSRYARPQSKAHAHAFTTASDTPITEEGRIIRQEMGEVVYRNEPLWRYVFENSLYHRPGVAAAYEAGRDNLLQEAPYHRAYRGDAPARIVFPVDAVMIKTNWLHEERALALGMTEDPENPFIKAEFLSPVEDNNAATFQPGMHYLLGIHISSKDIPNWTWATFEHVDNPGRCDYTGCNDSFGYRSPDAVGEGLADNYTRPKQQSDELIDPQMVFLHGEVYDDGPIRPALDDLLAAAGIGGGEALEDRPSIGDPAWRSYRLKGSQTNFVDAMGRPTLLGNSVTEGGFMASSSCMTCHARASVDDSGWMANGIFDPVLSDAGYATSAKGAPDPYWFVNGASKGPFLRLNALQTDFVWGFLFAGDLAEEAAPAGEDQQADDDFVDEDEGG